MARVLSIERKIIQEIGDIDVELIADRYDAGKADRALRRPIDHAGGDGAGLRNQRQIALAGHMGGKTGIEADAGHHDAQAVRSDQPHAVFSRGPLRRIRQRSRTVAESGRDDDGTRGAAPSGLIDEAGDWLGGAVMTTSSGANGNLSRLATVATPSISA